MEKEEEDFPEIVAELRKAKDCLERRYQWAITSLIGILCFTLGMQLQGERLSRTVYVNTTRVSVLETRLGLIEGKLDHVLEAIQQRNN